MALNYGYLTGHYPFICTLAYRVPDDFRNANMDDRNRTPSLYMLENGQRYTKKLSRPGEFLIMLLVHLWVDINSHGRKVICKAYTKVPDMDEWQMAGTIHSTAVVLVAVFVSITATLVITFTVLLIVRRKRGPFTGSFMNLKEYYDYLWGRQSSKSTAENVNPNCTAPQSTINPSAENSGQSSYYAPQPVFPIWDKRNESGHDLVYEDTKLLKNLCKAEPTLKEVVRMDRLYSHLRKYLTDFDEEYCTLNKTEAQQLVELIKYLKKGEVWMVHAFCKALWDNNQKRLILKVFPSLSKKDLKRYKHKN